MRLAPVLGLLAAGLLATVSAAPVLPAPAQTTDLPCGMVCDRTVEPLDVMVNGKVHVRVTCRANCEQTKKAIDVFFVVDRTLTMFDKRYMDPTKSAMITFVNKMDFETSAAGLITYAANEQVVTNLTHDRTRVLAGINAIRVSEETDVRGLQGAFRTATQKLDNDGTPGNERVVLIVAAGQDKQEANINMPTVTQAARNAGVTVVFLMFPDARYAHYVDASSDCSAPSCPRWSTPGGQPKQKMAWGVEPTDIGTILPNTVFDLLTASGDAITQVRIREVMHSCAAFDVGSSVPPPSSPQAPPYIAMDWVYPGANPLTVDIQYDAELVCGDDTYPVTSQTKAIVDTGSGAQIDHDLPNPLVVVRGPVTGTPTEPAAATPTGTATAPVTPPATTATPTASPTTTTRQPCYLPALLKAAQF